LWPTSAANLANNVENKKLELRNSIASAQSSGMTDNLGVPLLTWTSATLH